eukprot:SAG31_NODE_15752_length_740_cov_1.082683_1_plen_110_part_00
MDDDGPLPTPGFRLAAASTISIAHYGTATAQTTETHSFGITGMTCEGCVSRVKQAIEAVNGVVSVVVDLSTKKALVVLLSNTESDSFRSVGQAIIKAVEATGRSATACA